jgi:hypothetical protein
MGKAVSIAICAAPRRLRSCPPTPSAPYLLFVSRLFFAQRYARRVLVLHLIPGSPEVLRKSS